MSRPGYSDTIDGWDLIRWRGQVASAIKGKRGQAFLAELIDALDTMPSKRLIADDFWNGEACALGVVAQKRGIDVLTIDKYDYENISRLLGIAHQMVQEIEYINDGCIWFDQAPEVRWERMRAWAVDQLKVQK